MTKRDRLLIRLIVPVIVLGAFWLLVLSPKLDEMKTADKEIASARASLQLANAQLLEVRTNQARLRVEQRKLAAAGRAVPASLAIPSLLRQLERVASRTGVGLDAVTQGGGSSSTSTSSPNVGAVPADVDATSVSLNLAGRYRKIRRFLTRLDDLVRVSGDTIRSTGRLVSISSIAVAPSENGRLQVVVDTTIYTLKDAAAAAAAAASAAGSTTPESSSSASAPTTPAVVGAGG